MPTNVCEFFALTVEKVVGPFMRSHGFSLESTAQSRVVYKRDDVIVSFGYYLEDLPSPWVAIDIGRRTQDGSVHLVGLWRSIPNSAAERGYTHWKFHDVAGLEDVLTRMVDDLLPTFGRRLWEDDSLFSRVLAEQDAEVQGNYRRAEDRSTLLAARRAFDDGEYQLAVDRYGLLGRENLAAADLRRLHQARARLASSPNHDLPT